MGNNLSLLCPLLQKPCISDDCAWWGRKEANCVARILAKLPIMGVDPLEALLSGKKDAPPPRGGKG